MILAWLWLFIVGIAFLLSLLALIGEWQRRYRGQGTIEPRAPVLSDIMPRQEEVAHGSVKKFECQVKGIPTPDVTWYKDDVEITNDPRFQFSHQDGVVSCFFPDVTADDAGCYTCRAENSEGSALTAAFLSVRDVPEEAVVEEEVCASEHMPEQEQGAGFQDRVSSKPQSHLESQEGVPESEMVQEDKSPHGSLDDFAEAFVEELLGRPQGGVSKEADEGSGRPEPATDSVEPVTDASALEAGSPPAEGEDFDRLLSLVEDGSAGADNLDRESEGRRLRQTDSETGEARITDDLGGKPAIVMEIPANISVKEGETITIKCRIAAFPVPDVSWFKDGEPLVEDKRHVIKMKDDMFSLEVRDAKPIDAGEYTVTAINPEGKIYYNVNVEVLEKSAEKGSKEKSVRKPPEFVEKPSSMTVTEFEQLKLWCVVSGAPPPTVTWFREGKVLKDDGRTDIYHDGDKHYMAITKAFLRDAGEYTCTANNAVGAVFCSVYVTVEGATEGESGASTDYDLAVIEKLSPLIYEEIAKIQDEPTDEELFREYILKTVYTDMDKDIMLNEGEVIEVLDQDNPELWLVRKQEDRRKICKVPSNILRPKDDSDKNLSPEDEVRPALAKMQELTVQDTGDSADGALTPERRPGKLSRSPSKRTASSEGGDSSEDEDKLIKVEQYPVYIAIAEYTPPESDKEAPKLTEGQFVYVLDSKNPDRWYIQTKPTKTNPSKQGWVPPCYLDKKAGSGYIDKRSTREIFREDIIQITNKQTEALMKRRYALTELLETERDYIKELKMAMDQFEKLYKDGNLPKELVDKKDTLLANLSDIYNFHNDVFLSELMSCTNDPNSVGETFMKMESKFSEYIPYLKVRPEVEILLSLTRPKEALEKFEKKGRLDQGTMSNHLRKPRERLRTYETLLKDFLRYTSRAGEDVPRLTEAISMVQKLPITAENTLLMESIEEFPSDLFNVKDLIRHDDFVVWDAEAVGRGRDRHCLLFPDKIVAVKCKRPASHTDLPMYTYKGTINIADVQINELVLADEKFELWYAVPTAEKVTFEARNVHNKQAWVMELRELMGALGIAETDLPLEKIPEVEIRATSSPNARKKFSSGQEPKADIFPVSEPERVSDYNTAIDSYESDISTQDTSSYHTALDYDYDNVTTPVFTKKIRKMRATESDAVKFECVVIGNPVPQVTWYKDQVALKESNDVTLQCLGDRHGLVMRDLLRDDSGIYTVTATNEHGTTECSAQLLVTRDGYEETSQMTSDGDYGTAASIASEEGNSEIEATTPRLIRMPPEALDIKIGDEARIDCSILAYPEADIIWLKNGKELYAKDRCKFLFVDDETHSMVIQDAQAEDTGVYSFIGRNKHGECKADIRLTISEHRLPSFIKHMEDAKVIEGEKVKLECQVDGNPEPDFAWFCNDEILLPSEDFFMRFDGETCTFIIKEAFPEDSGIYTCQMTNSMGFAETRARLTVEKEELEVAPEIAQGFNDNTVAEGSACSFECIVTGSPKPDVTWSFNGEKVKSAGNIQLSQDDERYGLSILKASTKETGEYSCTATNKVGTAKCVAQLTVKDQQIAPKILKELEDITVDEGKPCTLECTISGKPQPVVTWMINGKKVESGPNIQLSQENDQYTLKIPNATLEDIGDYCCSAKNSQGSVKSSAKVKVNEAKVAPKITKGFEDTSIESGKACTLECTFSGKPSPDVSWTFNGATIKPTSNIKLSQDKGSCKLSVGKVSPKEAGEYSCHVENGAGSDTCKAKLTVTLADIAPKIENEFKDQTVEAGKTCTFQCSISGKPSPEIAWARDGKPLKAGDNISMGQDGETYSLTLAKSTQKDSGEYSITAKNSAGTASCAAKLMVQEERKTEKLAFASKPTDIKVADGKTAKFICTFKDKPSKVTWLKDGRELKPSTHYTAEIVGKEARLLIDNASLGDSGNYTCVAENEAGKVEATAELKVGPPPPADESPAGVFEEIECDEIQPVQMMSLESMALEPLIESSVNTQLERGPEDKVQVFIAPNKLKYTEIDPETIRLSWEPAETVLNTPMYYNIDFRESTIQIWQPLIHGLAETTYTVNNLDPKKSYVFRVASQTEYGISHTSPELTMPTRAVPKLAEEEPHFDMASAKLETVYFAPYPEFPNEDPPHVIVTKGDAVKLKWEEAKMPPGKEKVPTFYDVEGREGVDPDWSPYAEDLEDTEYTVEGLKPDEDYEFRVQPKNEHGKGKPTKPVKVPRRGGAPWWAMPTIPEYEEVGPDAVRISWPAAEVPKECEDKSILYSVSMKEEVASDYTTIINDLKKTNINITDLEPSKAYNFKIEASNEFGPSESCMELKLPERAVPMAPVFTVSTQPTPSKVEKVEIVLSWSSAETPKGAIVTPITYTVQAKESCADDWTSVVEGVKDTSAKVKGMAPEKEYALRVQAKNEFGTSEPTDAVTLAKRAGPPDMPSEAPKYTEKSPDTLELTWSAATTHKEYYESKISYIVEIREESVSTWKQVEKGVAKTSATVSNLEPNKAFAIQVKAQNEYGISKPTDEVKVPVRGIPGAPEWDSKNQPEISKNKDGTLKLSWSAATLPAGAKPTKITYTVEMQEGSGDWVTVMEGLPDTQFNVKAVNPRVNTAYRIQAANEFGLSEPSEAAEVHRTEALPEFPSDAVPDVQHIGKDSVKLTWPAAVLPHDVPFTPTLYNIEEKLEEEEEWSPIAEDLAETEYTIKGARPDKECQYRVHPKNKHGFGNPTKARRVPRRAGPPNLLPTIPEYDEIAPDSVELTWKPAETPKDFIDTPVQYTVEMKDEQSTDWQTIAKDLNEPNLKVQELEPSKKYQFRIQASNEYGPSDSTMELAVPERKVPKPPQFTVVGPPKLSKVNSKTPVLSWAPADTPEGGRQSPITYTIEAKEKDGKDWTPVVEGVKDTKSKVDGVSPDKEYELRVQAKNEFGASEPTEPTLLPKRAGPPELPADALNYDEKSPDTVELKWEKAQTAKDFLDSPISYTIEMSEGTSQKWATLVKGIAKTTCRIADLEPNQAYMFRVTAGNEYGQSQPSELLVKERTKPLPPQISNKKPPTVSEVKDNSLNLTWDAAETNPTGKPSPISYTVEAKDGADGKWRPLVEGIRDTQFKVEGVNPETDHSYRIKAKNEFGESEPSDAVNIAKRAGPPVMPEAEPEYSEINTESVKLSWKPAETAQGFMESPITYDIEIREETATEWKPLAHDVSSTTYTADNLEASKAYVFRVTAKNQFGESDHCKDLHVPDRLIPNPPHFTSDDVPKTSKLEKDSLTLSWMRAEIPKDSKPAAITYTIEAKEGAGDWKPLAKDLKDTSHKVDGVKPSEDVEFRVKAVNEFGSSDPTKVAKVEKRAGPPKMKDAAPKFSELSPQEVELSWNAATETEGYLKSPITYSIEIKEEAVGEWKPLVKGVTKTTYKVTDLDPKKAVEFKICAQNEFGVSEVCPQVKVPDRMKPMPPKTSTKAPEISKLDDNSLTMEWTEPKMPPEAKPTETTYDIEEKDAKGNWKPIAKDLKDTNQKIEGVTPDKEHEYRVQAKNEFGKGEPTKPVKVEKRAGPPVTKKGKPEFSEINPETVEITWDSATEEKGYIKAPISYDVEMREEGTKEFKPVVMDLAKTAFKVSDLEPSKAFVFKVTAKNEFGPSEVCQELKIPDRLKPLVPTMSSDAPKLGKVDKDSVKLAWSPAELPKHAKPSTVTYTVEEKEGTDWKPVAEDVKDANTAVKGVAPDKEHELRVVAKNEFGASEPTQPVKVEKRAGPPVMKKSTPKFKEIDPDTVELSWDAAAEEKGHIKVPVTYDIEMREESVSEWSPLVKDNAKTSCTASDLEPSKAFVFRMTAKNEYGTSEVSQELTVPDRMKELAPQLTLEPPTVSDLTKDSFTLNWPDVKQPKHAKPSKTTYNAEVKEEGSKDWAVLAKDLTEPMNEVKGIKPDKCYEYRVNAKNEFGRSEFTKPAKVEKRAGPPVMKKDKPEFKVVSPDVVELKWKPAEDKKDYIKSKITYTVELREESAKDFKVLSKSLEKPTYTAKDLDPCVAFTVRVAAENEYGKSDVSAELTIPARQVKAAPEMPDESPKVSKLEKDSCSLTWPEAKLPKNAKPSPLTYSVEVKVNGAKDWKEFAKDLKEPKDNVKDIKPDQEYEYRVLAKNEFGISKPSKPVKVEKRAGPPVIPKDGLAFIEVKPEVIELTWKKAEDKPGFIKSAITYIVEFKEEKAKEWKSLAESVEKPTYKAKDLVPAKAYVFRVVAKNEYGKTEPTEELLVPKRLIPKPPVMPKDAPKTDKLNKDSVELSWSAATLPDDAKPSPSTYTVEMKEGDSNDWKPVAKDLSETTHKVKDIKPDKEYELRVVANNEFGKTEPTKPVKIEKRAGPPSMPKDAPKYKDVKPEAGELSWKPAKSQKGFLESPITYQVEMMSEKDKKWAKVAEELKDPSYKVKDLDASLSYKFRVTAKNEYGTSEPTKEVTVEARLKKVPPVMQKDEPKVTGLDTDSPTLAWSAAKPEEGAQQAPVTYKIEAKEGDNGKWKVIAKDLKDPKHKLTDLKPDEEHQVRVVAENEFGASEPSKAVKIEKRAGPPTMTQDAPTLSDLNKNTPTLKWSPAKTKEGTLDSPITYNVEAKEEGSDKWKVIAKDVKDTKSALKDLKPEKAYEVRVVAKNKYGSSEATKPVAMAERTAPPLMPPANPKISDLDQDALTLSWKEATQQEHAIPSKISYIVEEKVGAKGEWKEIGKDIKKPTLRVKGLHPEEDCAYRVIAKNEFGKSDPTKHIILPKQEDEVDSKAPPDLNPIEPNVRRLNDEEVELSWDTPTADGQTLFKPFIYDIDFKEEEVEDWKPLVRGVADTSYRATELEPKKSYEFRVVPQVFQGFGDPWAEIVVPKRSVDQQKQKDAASAKAKGQERGVPPRMQFEAPKIADVQKSSLKLSWDEATLPPGAKKVPTTYIIEIKEGLGKGWKTLNDKVKDTQYKVKDLSADKEFSFRIIAKNEFGMSEPTLPATLNSRGGPPDMPFNKPKYTEVGPETVGLSWEAATNMKGMEDVPITYIIEMREPPNPDWETLVKNVKKTKVAIQDLHPGKSFSFRVTAENEYGVSEPTMPLTLPKRDAQYIPEEVRKPTYSLPSKSSVDVSWKASRMPVGCPDMAIVYDVEQCEYPSYDWATVAKGLKDCEFTAKDLKPERDYMYRVSARTKYGAADPSAPITARRKGGNLFPQHVKLAKPTVKPVGEDAAELSWRPAENPNNVSSPVTYVIEQREVMTSSWKEVATGIKDVQHQVGNLDPNKEYDFKLTPVNDFGRGDPYPVVTLTREGAKGKLPEGIRLTPTYTEMGPDAIQLSWLPNKMNDHNDVTYVIEQRMPNGKWKEIADNVPDAYHNLHQVAPDIELLYRVLVRNNFGTSPPSPVLTVRRKAHSNKPEGIREKPTITDLGPAAIQLSWFPPLRRTNIPITYIVEEKNPAAGDWKVVARDLEDTSLDIENLVPDRDYMYRVLVQNEHGTSEPSPSVMAHQDLDGLRPDAIVETPTITPLNDNKYKLSWVIPREPRSPQDYTLEIREPPSFRWQMVTTGIQDTNYELENVRPEKDYMYRVIVENDYGESEPSPAVSLRQGPDSYVPVMPREKPHPREMGLDTILLSWKPAHIPAEAASSEITYVIEVREPPDTEWRKLYTGIPDVSHRMTGLVPKQDYMFRVMAQNEYGLSEPTPPCTVSRKSSKCIPEPILNHPRKTLVGPDAVQLTWPPPYQPAHLANIPMFYIIEIREAPGSDWRPVAKDVKNPNYTVTGLRPDLGYGFRVRVGNEHGVSEPSPVVSLSSKWASDYLPRTPPDTPEITEVSIETIRVTWNPVRPPPGAPGSKVTYILEMREGKSTVWRPMVKEHPDTSVLMKDVSPEHEYSFRVRAQNEYGVSDPSRHATLPRRFALPEGILEKPFLLELGPDTAKISWRAPRLPTSLSRYQAKPYTYIIEVRDQSGNEWRQLAKDIKDTSYVIKDLIPDRDYLFRVRAQNQYGVSEPSLPVMKHKRSDASGRGSDSPAYTRKYLGPGFHRGYSAPEFVGDYDDTVYGVKEQPVKITCTISGYPEPKLMWYKDGEKLELGGRFNVYVTANGLCTLEIDAMQKADVGTYKIFAENSEGAATRYIRLELADPPVFLEPLKDLNLRVWTAGKMECRVDGLPYPEVKFFKDWHPLAHSARVKVKHEEYDYWSLDIDGAISRDEGMFICVAENIAGKIHCTASLHIEEKPPLVDIEIKPSNVSDFYHVLEEIGRGSCGVIRRVIEKCTHNEFAAKFLRARDKDHRNDLKQEFDTMAELSHPHIELLHDAFESNKKLVLVLELVTGPELLDFLAELDSITENDVAFYIKQLLEAVEYLHSKGVLHLDIKPENLYFTKTGSTDIKLIDFGNARKTYHEKETRINFGTPEFVAPEVVKGEPVTFATDCWHVGVLTYILLSGISPFHDANDKQTLTNVRECRWSFKNEAFDDITDVAKTFIASLLDIDPRSRQTASDCLNHPFIRLADRRGQGLRLPLDRLKIYSTRRKFERQLNLVRTIVYQRPISSILQDVPKIMIPGSDEDVISRDRVPFSPIGLSPSIGGPQGLLPPLACGIVLTPGHSRASSVAPSDDNTSSIDSGDYDFDLDDEGECPMEDWAGHYHSGPHPHTHHHDESKLKELKEKLHRTELDEKFAAVEAYVYKRSRSDRHKPKKHRKPKQIGGEPLVFKENLHDKGFNVGENVTMVCVVHGNPAPSIHWYRNEEPLSNGARLRSNYDHHTGKACLTVINTLPTDGGVYKCTARNPLGRIVTKARLAVGDHPSRPGRPVVTAVSCNEAFVMWEEPKSDGNGHILSYRLDYRKTGAREWTLGTHTINECALVQALEPDIVYRFRVNCVNKFGTSPYSFGSIEIRTKHEGAEPVPVDSETRRVLLRSGQEAETHEDSDTESPEVSRRSSMYEVMEPKKEGLETDIMLQEGDPEKYYRFGAQIWSGRQSTVLKCEDKNLGKEYVVKMRQKTSEETLREYNILKGLRQERICQLIEAYQNGNTIALILEPLSGEELIRGLCFKNRYTEETVCHIIRQLLDALQFLHNYGIVHLKIEPSNIMMISRRRNDIKIIDFSCARNITHEDGESFGKTDGLSEFFAPEMLSNEMIGCPADVWGVGVVAFVLLSGESPFLGETRQETISNISRLRYDAHHLHDNITKDALRFMYHIIKRSPRDRLTIEEALDHKWLNLADPMVKKRRSGIFDTSKLRNFQIEYQNRRFAMCGGSSDASGGQGQAQGQGQGDERRDSATGAAGGLAAPQAGGSGEPSRKL